MIRTSKRTRTCSRLSISFAFLVRSSLFLAVALLLSAHAGADTYKTEKDCVRDLEAVKARVQKWYRRQEGERVEKPSDGDFELELQFAENKELCSTRYIAHVGLYAQWPEGKEAYSKEELERLKEWTTGSASKILPDFPVLGSQSEEPPSLLEWRRAARQGDGGEPARRDLPLLQLDSR